MQFFLNKCLCARDVLLNTPAVTSRSLSRSVNRCFHMNPKMAQSDSRKKMLKKDNVC